MTSRGWQPDGLQRRSADSRWRSQLNSPATCGKGLIAFCVLLIAGCGDQPAPVQSASTTNAGKVVFNRSDVAQQATRHGWDETERVAYEAIPANRQTTAKIPPPWISLLGNDSESDWVRPTITGLEAGKVYFESQDTTILNLSDSPAAGLDVPRKIAGLQKKGVHAGYSEGYSVYEKPKLPGYTGRVQAVVYPQNTYQVGFCRVNFKGAAGQDLVANVDASDFSKFANEKIFNQAVVQLDIKDYGLLTIDYDQDGNGALDTNGEAAEGREKNAFALQRFSSSPHMIILIHAMTRGEGTTSVASRYSWVETSFFTPNGGPPDLKTLYLAMCHELCHQMGIPQHFPDYLRRGVFTAEDPQNLMIGVTLENGPHLNHVEWEMIRTTER